MKKEAAGGVVTLEFAGKRLEVELYDNPSARAVAGALPQAIRMSRWGDGEYYGGFACEIPAGGALQEVFAVGEVALWPDGNAFCIFFGPTPASRGTEPRMASPGVPLGRIRGDAGAFRTAGPRIEVRLAG